MIPLTPNDLEMICKALAQRTDSEGVMILVFHHDKLAEMVCALRPGIEGKLGEKMRELANRIDSELAASVGKVN